MNVCLGYHYPCLDGAFSVMVVYLYMKYFLEQTGKPLKRVIELIKDSLGYPKGEGVPKLGASIKDNIFF